MDEPRKALLDAAARPFLRAGRSAWHFARGKLRFDPVFFYILRHGFLPNTGTLFDLGCGQGVLLSLILAASRQYRCGLWPAGWPEPPQGLRLGGVERSVGRVAAARAALGAEAKIEQGDVRVSDIPSSSAIVLFDVLMYLEREEQRAVLERVLRALEPGGVLLMRETDAQGGVPYQAAKLSEQVMEIIRGRFPPRLYYRAAAEWADLLESLNLDVHSAPMSATPFSNVLFIARRSAA